MFKVKQIASLKARNKKHKAKNDSLKDLVRRLIFLLIAFLIYRVGSHMPVPGLDPRKIAELFASGKGGIFGLFNLFSGGALSRLSIFSLGVMPYISSSIIIQLLTMALPQLDQLKKEGNAGRRKISQYTRLLTLALATFQSLGMAKFMSSSSLTTGFFYYFTVCLTLVSGTMFLMWLGEQITERGIGNGVSMLIFAGIVANLPASLANMVEKVRQGDINPIGMILLLCILGAVVALIVFIEGGERRITVHYARKQRAELLGAMKQDHLPFKINMAGVIPPIFASSIILFPATLSQWFGSNPKMSWLSKIGMYLSPGQPVYVILFGCAIVFFCFFYTALIFNPTEAADNLKKREACIAGIRPGEQTVRHLDEIVGRLTIMGAIYIASVSLFPELLVLLLKVPFYFGGTSLLIVVAVAMEFRNQIESYMMSHQYQYSALMGKARFKSGG